MRIMAMTGIAIWPRSAQRQDPASAPVASVERGGADSLRHSAGCDGDTGNTGICLEARTAPLLTVGTAAAHSVLRRGSGR